MDTWMLVCEQCGKEWRLEDEEQARKHEARHKHTVYQEKKENEQKKPRSTEP